MHALNCSVFGYHAAVYFWAMLSNAIMDDEKNNNEKHNTLRSL